MVAKITKCKTVGKQDIYTILEHHPPDCFVSYKGKLHLYNGETWWTSSNLIYQYRKQYHMLPVLGHSQASHPP